MSGIAGIIDLDKRPIDARLLIRMNNSMKHRGQDDEGYVLINQLTGICNSFSGAESCSEIKGIYPQLHERENNSRGNIGLSHRRFAIIDLTSSGHQPFFIEDRSCCVVFNGQIYNYIELRNELKRKGYIFQTNSDTEVFVKAFKEWGIKCFERFNGSWAAVIYDFNNNKLILSRDRIGKKPLYWSKKRTQIYFASEIKALFQVPEVAKTKNINEDALYSWIRLHKKDLDSCTFFHGIYSFPAASWAVIDQDFPNNIVKFWHLSKFRLSENDVSVEEAIQLIREILISAIQFRLRADVPIAVELSGGVDSSALISLASKIHKDRITAYTIAFSDPKWNEESFARSVAEYCGVDYRCIYSAPENFWPGILPFTYLEEEPYHSPNLQTNQIIWATMRKDGIKVSLNGAAGDEVFAGYKYYFRNAQYENLRAWRIVSFLQNMCHWTEGSGIFRKVLESAGSLLLIRKSVFNLLKQLKAPNNNYLKVPIKKLNSSNFTLSEILHGDMIYSMMPYWMISGDKGHMGIPIELRTPFLDYRLVEFVYSLPTSYLIRNGWHKWILRRSLIGDLPEHVLWRKKKMGFPFPYDSFFESNEAIIDTILCQAQNPYIDFSKKNNFKNSWHCISFILWYEFFFNENFDLFRTIARMGQKENMTVCDHFKPAYLNCYGISNSLGE